MNVTSDNGVRPRREHDVLQFKEDDDGQRVAVRSSDNHYQCLCFQLYVNSATAPRVSGEMQFCCVSVQRAEMRDLR